MSVAEAADQGWKRAPLGAFVVALLLLLAAGGALLFSLHDVGRSAERVAHTYEVIGRTDELLGSLKDAETGQRGYLLTGEARYLRPYEQGRLRVRGALAALRGARPATRFQRERLPAVEALARGKLAELDRTVALARGGDTAAAIAILRAGEGKALMDRLRAELTAFSAEERRLLAQRRAVLEERERAGITRALLLAGGAMLAAVLGALLLFRRGRLTEIKLARTTAESQRQAALLQQTYDTAPVGLAFHDAQLRYVVLNERLAIINDRPAAAHIGKTPGELAPELAQVVEPILRRVLETGEPAIDLEISTTVGSRAGGPRDYLCSYWPVRDAAGAVSGISVAVLDVSDRRAVERRLAESEARLRAIYDAVPVGLVTAEMPDGRITGANAHLEAVVGHPVKLSGGVSDYGEWVSYHPDGRPVKPHEYPLARIIAEGVDAAEAEVIWDRQGERRWVKISGRAIKGDDGRKLGGVVAMLDIDELKRAEERLTREVALRTAELEAANAQLEAFAYTVSHDLRAPLRGMEGFARILLEDFPAELGEQGTRYAERIVAAAERMERLIDDLLTYSRIQRVDVELRAFDPTPVARAAAANAQDDDAIITVEDLPAVVAEPTVLGHVLGNLLSNAVKFRKANAPAHVRVWGETKGGRVRLWVEDDGIGIAPEHQGRIFNAFERLHGQEAYAGTGIGLAIVEAGVRRLGGSVGLESAENRGAHFWVELETAPDAGDQPGDECARGLANA